METRKDSIGSYKLCRFCLSQDETLSSLYESKKSKKSIPLTLKILSSVSMEVYPSDKMPCYICSRCKFFMNMCYEYKQICRNADESLLKFIQTGIPLDPVTWPPSLMKLVRTGTKPTKVGVMKTVVEGGATVEVMSQDVSDSEDGDENVYNVKIEDGSNEGTSAFVKVVSSKDDAKDKKNKKEPEFSIQGGCWACDECECTYPLQQLLELHKMQKHRARTVECEVCNSKFFSKYQLTTHQQQHHADNFPFECVACGAKFKVFVHLKRHELLTHSELLQHKCGECSMSFISPKEYEVHQKRHKDYNERAFSCHICNKKFSDKSTLQRHREGVHSLDAMLPCEYCPQRFTSVTKLARHVRSHAGDRPYPCKYCEKSFTKSHHYTRHVRLKHSDCRNSREPFGATDSFQCEQCSSSFATQDELIYHSAIHATQNLICPLCQEKFEDVDAVTSHIKSHVSGLEFMCDFCELVFTSKDKLDLHLVVSHEDEISQQDLEQDESSMETDIDEDDAFKVKEEDDHMVVEIKKPNNFMITNQSEDKTYINSEESETEMSMPDISVTEQLVIPVEEPVERKIVTHVIATSIATPVATPVSTPVATPVKTEKKSTIQTASILRRAEEVKRKSNHQTTTETVAPMEKKEKQKGESSSGASDKSLRLLEKELQELQRTTTRNETAKTPTRAMESLRSRRPQMHTSTPKLRSTEDKKSQSTVKSMPVEKRLPERRGVKENKKPEEGKEPKANNVSKEVNDVTKDVKKEEKEKEPRANISKEETKEKVVNNGGNNKSNSEDSTIRRSSRPSKVKDYAKMIRDKPDSMDSDEDDSDDDEDDEEYSSKDVEKTPEIRPKARRASIKPQPKPPQPKATPARKRGRPRKELPVEVPSKIRKDESDEDGIKDNVKAEVVNEERPEAKTVEDTEEEENVPDSTPDKQENESKQPSTGIAAIAQTLKKVPIRALPPGIKPLPLPMNARSMGPGELCEMQIGKKVVKVQKIVMTKAEVEAMAKKGLVEMKDGTMVLKQGIKIPTSDPAALKSTLVGEESSRKGAPTRCDLGD